MKHLYLGAKLGCPYSSGFCDVLHSFWLVGINHNLLSMLDLFDQNNLCDFSLYLLLVLPLECDTLQYTLDKILVGSMLYAWDISAKIQSQTI